LGVRGEPEAFVDGVIDSGGLWDIDPALEGRTTPCEQDCEGEGGEGLAECSLDARYAGHGGVYASGLERFSRDIRAGAVRGGDLAGVFCEFGVEIAEA